ncbi:MAG TPA: pyridoxal-phosphate dependent enzyme [Candidatus Lokiarchaeia archaeon]|nr:pyridoxal-phosphate dependent enzyme [Candidatus Lokiarchaeia archaeon]
MITYEEVVDAHERIKDVVNKTPVMMSRTLNAMVDATIYCKCENFQRMGAFKMRGAYNTVSQLNDEEKEAGVITHSSGNHAQALALSARLLGIKAVVIMPSNSPQVKINATKGYGAEVVLCEPTLEAREETTNALIAEHGYTLVHPYDNDNIIRGAGTAAYELIKEIGDLDFLFCPVGGGGLLSGTSIATKGACPDAKVIAVEPENADDAFKSFRAGEIVINPTSNTIADGLRTHLCERTFSIIKENVDDIILVSEQQIIDAMRFLWERMKIVVEPSGAVSLAGVLSCQVPLQGQRVGVIISGGNIDLEEFFLLMQQKIA